MRCGTRREGMLYELSPELRLRMAVLEEAMQAAAGRQCGSASVRLAQRNAREWFASDVPGPFAFVSICEALGLDPDYVRRLAGVGESEERHAVGQ